MKRRFLALTIALLLLGSAPIQAATYLDGELQGESQTATSLQGKAIAEPTSGDDGKYIFYDHPNSQFDYATPAGGGNMDSGVWDGDSDTFIDQDAGGLDADISGYAAGLLGHTAAGDVQDTDTEAELETALGSINVIVSTEINEFSEVQSLVADKTLLNEEDNAQIDGLWTFSQDITPEASDSASLGTDALDWSDLFLADGAVIDLGSGDITLTHSADTLTFAGGSLTDGTASWNASSNALAGFSNITSTKLTSTELEYAGNITIDAINAGVDSTITLTNSDGTYEANLIVEGDLTVGGGISSSASGESYIEVNNNVSLAPSGNRLYVEANEWKVSENGNEETILTDKDGATLTGSTWSFAGVTNMILPTAAADSSGEISISSGNQFKWHDGTKVVTIDTTATNDNYVLKYTTATATLALEPDETGGTPLWSTVGDPDTDTIIEHQINEETTFLFSGDYTTGSQFLISQTGDPSGGTLFEVLGDDPQSLLAKIGDGTNYWSVSYNGVLSNSGTAFLNLAAASNLWINGAQIDFDDMAGTANLTTSGLIAGTGVNATGFGRNELTLSGTLNAFNGSDSFRGIYIDYDTTADHTGTGNYVSAITIHDLDGDENTNTYGLKIGSMAGTTGAAGEQEIPIIIGPGWDKVLWVSGASNHLSMIWDDTNEELEFSSNTGEELVIDLDTAVDNQVSFSGTGTGVTNFLFADDITIGTNADDDYKLTFDADEADGVITWQVDEQTFSFSGVLANTPQAYTVNADVDSATLGAEITSSTVLITTDNDDTDEEVDLQDGGINGQQVTFICVSGCDAAGADSVFIDAEEDSTCTGCPDAGVFELGTTGDSVTLVWSGSAWFFVGRYQQ